MGGHCQPHGTLFSSIVAKKPSFVRSSRTAEFIAAARAPDGLQRCAGAADHLILCVLVLVSPVGQHGPRSARTTWTEPGRTGLRTRSGRAAPLRPLHPVRVMALHERGTVFLIPRLR